MTATRIAVIGFGFSGLMVVANLVRTAISGTVIYVIADDLRGQGMAYSTRDSHHLLNVPIEKMGAFADVPDGFYRWLNTHDAAVAKQVLGITRDYGAGDFAPRALFAAYLSTLWQETQQLAATRGVMLKLVESGMTAIMPGEALAVLTARGDAVAVDRVVLATGNETKPILPHLPPGYVVQNPWAADAFHGAASWAAPVMVMGVGLTAIDTVLALRSAGYAGDIVAFSRHGWLPHTHQSPGAVFAFDAPQLCAQQPLSALLRYVRQAMAETGEWRVVIDALRPHTQTIWQRLSQRDKQRFLARLLPRWNVHRHRMAPKIAVAIDREISAGTTTVIAARRPTIALVDSELTVTLNDRTYRPSRIVNCTGPQLDVTKSASHGVKQMVADGIVEPHATGLGIAVDPALRAWGRAYPRVYALGNLVAGQLLESTAVPELRAQAAQVAADIVASFTP